MPMIKDTRYAIVPLTAETIPGAAAVEAACFSQPWSKQGLLSELQKEGACCFVALAEAANLVGSSPVAALSEASTPALPLQVLGWAGLETVYGEGSVTNIAVLPQARGLGIGKALTQALLDAANALSLERVLLEVRASNAVAIALYQQLGFVSLGIRPRFYDHPQEDALMMQWSPPIQPEETI